MKWSRNLHTFAAGALLTGVHAVAQTKPAAPDVWSHSALLAKSRELAVTAKQHNGAASIKLANYPGHFTMLAFRSQSGGAEVHEHFADIFVILKGSATLLTGGTVVDQKTASPGELTGTSLDNAASQPLHAGDVVHIPAGTPHRLVLPKGGTLTYFVVKVKES
jgi:mannose-6-phosphate isomerase-like protein (cupin superfamily)